MTSLRCAVCGKEIHEAKPCAYNERYGPTCDECCQKCYETEPFPCYDHDRRLKEQKE